MIHKNKTSQTTKNTTLVVSHAKETQLQGVKEILNFLIKSSNITEAELARQTGLPQATLNRILLGGTEDPRVSTLIALSRFFNLTLGQLVGTEPLLNNSASNTIGLPDHARLPILNWEQIVPWIENTTLISPFNHKNWIITERKVSPRAFALKTLPFMEPRFRKNSVVICDPNIPYDDGYYVVALVNGQPTVRKVIKDAGQIHLRPFDPDLPLTRLGPSIKILSTIVETRHEDYSVNI